MTMSINIFSLIIGFVIGYITAVILCLIALRIKYLQLERE